MIRNIIHDIKTLPIGAKVLMALATLITLICSLIAEPNNYLGIIGALSGILFVSFVANKKISTFYFGAMFSAIYSYLAFKNGIYGDFSINAFYHLPTQFIGLYMWKKNGVEEHNADVRSLSYKGLFVVSIAVMLAIYLCSPILTYFGGNYVLRDTATNICSITAMLLMMNRYKQQWLFWIIVNATSCYMWYSVIQNTGVGYATLIQWIVFLLNSLYGAYNWYKRD